MFITINTVIMLLASMVIVTMFLNELMKCLRTNYDLEIIRSRKIKHVHYKVFLPNQNFTLTV